MKKMLFIAAAVLCAAFQPARPALSRIVTPDEARLVAGNYITLVVNGAGSWGGTPVASVAEIEELRRDGRLLGYWCHVEPAGHVIVSIHSELSPVKASSETWDGDPSCDADIVDVIKLKIEQEHDYIESRLGPIEAAPDEAVALLLEYSSRDTWALLTGRSEDLGAALAADEALADYQEGMVLLTTNWHQGDPYNLYMPPNPACSAFNGHRCAAGCTALGATQIMKYWDWPPYGMGSPYDDYYYWTFMPDELAPSSPFEQINPVAVLIAEIGQACLMDYCMDDGCGSGAFHADMLAAYKAYFRFHTSALIVTRLSCTSETWFDLIRTNLDQNMPLQYEVPNHSVVCDGWRIVSTIRQYHMNYGWANYVPDDEACWAPYLGTGSNTWFTLDLLPCPDLSVENVITFLCPAVSLGQNLSGTYTTSPSFPWRYVNVDAAGEDAVFQAGQMIQSLADKTLRCTSASGGAIRFYGAPAQHTRLFKEGDTSRGILVTDGAMVLYGGGGIHLH